MQTVPDLFSSLVETNPPLVRFLLKDLAEWTEWGSWVEHPSKSYWELQGFGPFRMVDVKKCQFQFKSANPSLTKLMEENGFVLAGPNLFERDFE